MDTARIATDDLFPSLASPAPARVATVVQPRAPRRFSSVVLSAIVAVAAITLVLGIAREVLILTIGEGTFLQEGRHFDLDGEANLPAWFASFAWLVASVLSAAFAFTATARRDRRLWGVMAILFAFVSVDEVASFHESIMDPLREALGLGGVLHYAWIIPALAVVLVLAIAYFRFIAALDRPVRNRIVLAAVVFVSGAAGMEMIGGLYISGGGSEADLAYRLEILAEEGLEILGVVILLRALLLQWDRMGLTFGRRDRDAADVATASGTVRRPRH